MKSTWNWLFNFFEIKLLTHWNFKYLEFKNVLKTTAIIREFELEQKLFEKIVHSNLYCREISVII